MDVVKIRSCEWNQVGEMVRYFGPKSTLCPHWKSHSTELPPNSGMSLYSGSQGPITEHTCSHTSSHCFASHGKRISRRVQTNKNRTKFVSRAIKMQHAGFRHCRYKFVHQFLPNNPEHGSHLLIPDPPFPSKRYTVIFLQNIPLER